MGKRLSAGITAISALVLTIVALSTSAFAQQVTVFGPKVYEKEVGKPVTYNDSFAVPRGVQNVRILVRNGTPDAGEVKNLSVSLNGSEVVSTGDVRATTTTEKLVTYRLSSLNALTVSLKGQGGNAVVVEIVGDQPDIIEIGPVPR